MLTGELPFRGNVQMQIHQKLHADVPDPRKLNRHIPADMATICLKCLESDPNKRYGTSLELGDELRRFMRGEPIQARPISTLARAARWSRRNPAAAAVIALTAFLAIAGPVAALVIGETNRRLALENSENQNLVRENASQIATLHRRVAELNDYNKTLSGQRPDRAEFADWKENLIHKFLEERYADAASAIESESSVAEEQVRAHLGLAMLLSVVKRDNDAIRHFNAAKVLLTRLSEENPRDVRMQLALADCCSSLGKLFHIRDPRRSAAEHQESLAIRETLRRDGLNRVDSDMAYVDTLFDSEIAKSDASEHVNRLETMRQARDQILERLSSDPAAIYELCCELNIAGPRLGHAESLPDTVAQ
jgi:hypothetical protein